jgi:hypothetical protein
VADRFSLLDCRAPVRLLFSAGTVLAKNGARRLSTTADSYVSLVGTPEMHFPRRPRRSARFPKAHDHRDGGQALAEFVVVVPALLLLFFGIVELGAAWRTYQVVTNTAREGARAAVLPTATQARVDSIVQFRLSTGGLEPGNATVEVICAAGPGACFPGVPGQSTEVRISYPHTFILLGPVVELATGGSGASWGTVTLSSGLVMRNE